VKQVLQDLRSGAVTVREVPEPVAEAGRVLIAVERSLISAGTERASATLGAKSLVQKARARPDLVRKTIEVAQAEGVGAAAMKVRSRLDHYAAFGYSVAGRVLDTGGDARFVPGDIVAGVGADHASHAQVVSVPSNLVVPAPAGVGVDAVAFAAPAAIALHALRLSRAAPGAVVAVVGLGLIGQIAGRLLRASGIRAIGTDPRDDRCRLFGAAAGANQVSELVAEASRGRGADAVLVCAATPSSEPVGLACEVARDRGVVVVVGDVGLELDRRVMYEKELELVVARSYGPGRYDRAYEEQGLDYPPGYVRWTEGRNIEAVLDLATTGSLQLADLITHRFPIEEGDQAYAALLEDRAALGIILEYETPTARQHVVRAGSQASPRDGVRVALVGTGSYARSTLVPALRSEPGLTLAAVCARSGASATSLADKNGVGVVSTDWRELVGSDEIDAVVIATPHDTHALIAAASLRAGKSTWVEKPLAVTWDGLAEVAAAAHGGLLLVGHNRRFAPLAVRMRNELGGPRLIQIRVAAGPLAEGHWVEDPQQGGRILGEISHFVDLASFLVGNAPESVWATSVPAGSGDASLLAVLRFNDGSAATIAYGVGRAHGMPKERVEVLGPGGVAVLDDFRRLELYRGRRRVHKQRRDKGQRAAMAAFAAATRGDAPLPVSIEEQLLVAAASLAVMESAYTGEAIRVQLAR
jgi:predicted dehydrogenase/threonine dehydrogenase-like Zn-dependent dehydrogenase